MQLRICYNNSTLMCLACRVRHCNTPEHLMYIKTKPFVQCLHENRNHWITVSTVGCSTGVVQVYDSLQHHKPSTSLKCIIADMLQSSNDSIVVQYIKMQEQLRQVIVAFLLLQLLLQYAMVKMFVCLSLTSQ